MTAARQRSGGQAVLTAVRSRGAHRSGKPPPVESIGTGRCGGPGRPKRTARPLGDLQGGLPLPAMGRQRSQGGVKVGHPVHQDRPVPSRCSANSTSGERSVSWIAATLVPIASTAKTTRPPRTSAKYARSVATSRLGVYTKSSCWKGAGWSVTGRGGGDRASHRARAPWTSSDGTAGSTGLPQIGSTGPNPGLVGRAKRTS
jgi:hypothetical protein